MQNSRSFWVLAIVTVFSVARLSAMVGRVTQVLNKTGVRSVLSRGVARANMQQLNRSFASLNVAHDQDKGSQDNKRASHGEKEPWFMSGKVYLGAAAVLGVGLAYYEQRQFIHDIGLEGLLNQEPYREFKGLLVRFAASQLPENITEEQLAIVLRVMHQSKRYEKAVLSNFEKCPSVAFHFFEPLCLYSPEVAVTITKSLTDILVQLMDHEQSDDNRQRLIASFLPLIRITRDVAQAHFEESFFLWENLAKEPALDLSLKNIIPHKYESAQHRFYTMVECLKIIEKAANRIHLKLYHDFQEKKASDTALTTQMYAQCYSRTIERQCLVEMRCEEALKYLEAQRKRVPVASAR